MRSSKTAPDHRLQRLTQATLYSHGPGDRQHAGDGPKPDAVLNCGWGRLIFGHTFESPQELTETLRAEAPGHRDVAFYVRDPHVAISLAPQELFLDPSHTYRLWMSDYRPSRRTTNGFAIAPVRSRDEIGEVNRIYGHHGMMTVDPEFLWRNRNSRKLTYLVAKDDSGHVLGVVMGADHRHAFNDPENGSSLWSLAVDPQAALPGVGEALVRRLAERYKTRGRAFMDLSVMHDNQEAVALYEKLAFRRVPVFTLKKRNSINERLYAGPAVEGDFNPYAQIIIDEARRRGIAVDPLDPPEGYFRLSFGGRSITCRESLSEMTSAVAMSRCDDKTVTRRLLERAGLRVPAQRLAGTAAENAEFLKAHGAVVAKPARGEQGAGVSVDIRDAAALERAITRARKTCDKVILEAFVKGDDLRIIVIDGDVVAAAIRRPAEIVGTGRHTVAQLIDRQSRRRAAATGGESRIPVDDETKRAVRAAGYGMDDVLPEGETVRVRKTANLHTGGTIHDVTPRLHPTLAEAAQRGAEALEIPVVGFDFMVPDVEGEDYVVIEANERPGLANHEPQPTAQRFVDLLFPQTALRRPGPNDQAA
ncbi:MAG TPA: N-acetylglutaminylglutamine synthetase [Alphaproteobacteria bacterium]|nr:N-acetylglutaminylglutamine synthetase [Alphaproteobacteria bacterium]